MAQFNTVRQTRQVPPDEQTAETKYITLFLMWDKYADILESK